MELGKAINYILKNDSGLSSYQNKIFPNRIPIGVNMPCIVYQIVSNSPSNTKNGVSNLDVFSVNITAFGDTYQQMESLSQLIRNAMDYQLPGGGSNVIFKIQQITLTGESDEYDESFGDHGIHYRVLEFNIRQAI